MDHSHCRCYTDRQVNVWRSAESLCWRFSTSHQHGDVSRKKKNKKRKRECWPARQTGLKDRRDVFVKGGGIEKKDQSLGEGMCARHVSLNICLVNHMSFFHSFRLALSISCSCPKALFPLLSSSVQLKSLSR